MRFLKALFGKKAKSVRLDLVPVSPALVRPLTPLIESFGGVIGGNVFTSPHPITGEGGGMYSVINFSDNPEGAARFRGHVKATESGYGEPVI